MAGKWECIKSARFDGDIVITDPCYLSHGGCELLEDCENWEPWVEGHGGLINSTYYGDWGCKVFSGCQKEGVIAKSSTAIGEFCADAGMVCVVKLDDVLKESPKFIEWLGSHMWCGAVIRGFKGTVKFIVKKTPRSFKDKSGEVHRYEDIELHVRGEGTAAGDKIEFESLQTS